MLNNIVALLGNGGGAANSYESIATFTSSGSTSSITFSSIPSTYKHLQLRILSRSAYAAATDQIYMRLNSDSGTNYSWHYLRGDGASATASGYASDNIIYAATTPAASASASIFGVSIIDILDYGNTNKNKTVRILDGYDANGSGIVELRSSGWYSTSAISTILLANYMAGSNFASGSSFALYGVKG